MLSIILNWIYIALICIVIGSGILGVFKGKHFSLIYCLVAGIIAVTVYTEFFSIFARIGVGAHLILLAVTLVSGYHRRRELGSLGHTCCRFICGGG